VSSRGDTENYEVNIQVFILKWIMN